MTPDRLAAFAGDEITFSIDATFLEGSPVPGLALNYDGSMTGQVTTDGGHASVTATAGEGDEPSYGATSTGLTVTPVRAEEGEIIGEAWASVYPASVTAWPRPMEGSGPDLRAPCTTSTSRGSTRRPRWIRECPRPPAAG